MKTDSEILAMIGKAVRHDPLENVYIISQKVLDNEDPARDVVTFLNFAITNRHSKTPRKVRLKEGVSYWQDFSSHTVDKAMTHIVFDVERSDEEHLVLRAQGYGDLSNPGVGGSYGSGAVYVNQSGAEEVDEE